MIGARRLKCGVDRGITPKDTDRLRRFRDKLRYDRELYAKRQSSEIVTTGA